MQTDYSPWGEIQALETLYPGIHLITTPGHGGIMAEWPAYLELSVAARKCGFRENGCLWFEEDCCEQVVLRELLDRGMGRCRIESATRQSLKKESTESSSSITRTIGQSEKRAAPFRKPAKCERKTICLSERGNKPIKPYKTMTLRLNAAEYAHLCRQAEVTGLKKEPLVRQLIMGVNLRPRPPMPMPTCFGRCPPSGTTSTSWPIRPTQGARPPVTRSRKRCIWCGRPHDWCGSGSEWHIRKSLLFITGWTDA